MRRRVRSPLGSPEGTARAWTASSDLIAMQHEHPYRTDGDKEIEFQVTFPRPGAYRLWIQVQSDGIVSTVRFDVPVTRQELGDAGDRTVARYQ